MSLTAFEEALKQSVRSKILELAERHGIKVEIEEEPVLTIGWDVEQEGSEAFIEDLQTMISIFKEAFHIK